MIQRFLFFLGPARSRALFLLIGITGALSLILNAVIDAGDWVRPVQSLLSLSVIVGAAIIIGGRMEPEERSRWLAILVPAVGALFLGLFFLPSYLGLLVGAALGWVVAGLFIFRARGPMAYRQAVRYLRKNDYAEAVKHLDLLIKQEPNDPNHYRFRAELLRVWGKLDRARRDYLKMVDLAPDSASAFNGLAEVYFQSGDYHAALDAAHKAVELAPDDWVAFYNLGMIEDRLGQSNQVVPHLEEALEKKVRDGRHRARIHFYLARAHQRLGDADAARAELAALKHERTGLDEWAKILESDQAATLEKVLGEDIQRAQELANGTIDLAALGEAVSS
ncbi:MAG: tetratricopeptide repeat protein [Anaerolineae bacterium]|nr:tetratricopeptide repeat protein [Anaerolineae bacterium]